MIKYLGSKKKLLNDIYQTALKFHNKRGTFLDVFSGTCRVGHHFKRNGHTVYANDLGTYAFHIARCLIEGNLKKHRKDADALIRELNQLEGKAGWFTKTYCEDSRYFKPKNGERIDAIRESIEEKQLEPVMKSILLTSLILAADKVDSTTGVQMAYLKQWADRAENDLILKLPELVDGPVGKAYNMDAAEIGQVVGKVQTAYLDPPYNQHSYLGNYHIWESLVQWDKPEVYGIAKKRVDCKVRKSDFNKKNEIADALKRTIKNIDADLFIISFNDEGFLTIDEIKQALKETDKGQVILHDAIKYKRYVGAQIGIFDKKGKKVGKVSHLENNELLFTISKKTDQSISFEDFIPFDI